MWELSQEGKGGEMHIKVEFNGEAGGLELMLQHIYVSTVEDADVKNTELTFVILTKTKITI